MSHSPLPGRFVALPLAEIGTIRAPIALTFRSRLLGLAFIGRERAGPGLLIPRCGAVHTFGMRFAIEVVFLDSRGIEIRRARVSPWRFARERRADAVLEIPLGAPPDDRS